MPGFLKGFLQKEEWSPKPVDVERVLLPARWHVTIIVMAGLFLLSLVKDIPYRGAILFLVTVVVIYNLGISALLERGMPVEHVGFISSIVHGLTASIGIALTGGLKSPFMPILTITLVAHAVRHSLKFTIASALIFTTIVQVGSAFINKSVAWIDLIIFTTFTILLVWMVNTLNRRGERKLMVLLDVAMHELRNPLATIKASLALLKARRNINEASEDFRILGVVAREVDYLSTLLGETLQAFGVHEGSIVINMRRIDLRETVIAAGGSFSAMQVEPRVEYQVPPQPTLILGDSKRLEEVFRNLISNALKYSSEGETVQVQLAIHKGKALISVIDQGIGIPREQIGQVFEGFFRASNANERDPGGLGLGLYICRDIIERHKGRIWVESEEGVGSEFFVEIPLCASEANKVGDIQQAV